MARPDLRGIAQLALLEAGQVRGEVRGQLGRRPCRAGRAAAARHRAEQEFARGQQLDHVDRADTALVGRVERAQRLDLVAEPLDADGQRLAGREDVDDAAASCELAAAGDLGQCLVAKLDELAQDPLLANALPDLELDWLGRQLGRRERVLEERLDAGHEHLRNARLPCSEGGDASGRSRRGSAPALVGERGARLQRHDRVRVAEPRLRAPRRRDRRSQRRARSRRGVRRWRRQCCGEEGLGAMGHVPRR